MGKQQPFESQQRKTITTTGREVERYATCSPAATVAMQFPPWPEAELLPSALHSRLESNSPPWPSHLSVTLSDTFSARPFYYASLPPRDIPWPWLPVQFHRTIKHAATNSPLGNHDRNRAARQSETPPRPRAASDDDDATSWSTRRSLALISHKTVDDTSRGREYDLRRPFPSPDTHLITKQRVFCNASRGPSGGKRDSK